MEPSAGEHKPDTSAQSEAPPREGEPRRRRRKKNNSRKTQQRVRKATKIVLTVLLFVLGIFLAAGTALYLGRPF